MPRNFRYRLFEVLPGAVSWTILIAPFALSIWFPRTVAIFIAMYVILLFLRSMKSSAFLIHSYFKSKRYEKLDWIRLLSFFSDNPAQPATSIEEKTAQIATDLRERGNFKKWKDIRHVIIIPTYKEEKEILESSLEAVAQVDFPLDKIMVILATEARDKMRAETNAAYLEKRFEGTFGKFMHVMHPANLPDELPAKGANITFAARAAAKMLREEGVDFSNVLVTTLDADNRPSPSFFANLTYHYLAERNRERRSFQPLSYFYNNIWEVPFANRIIALANTFWWLSEAGEPHHLFNASVYSQSLDSLAAMDFWSKQTIVEDLHQFWRAYFHFKGDHEVIPLFVPVYQDALENRTYFTSLTGQYKQLRRWAWGVSEIAYVMMKTVRNRAQLPLIKSFSRVSYMWYLQTIQATMPVIILFNKTIPSIINPQFAKSLFAYNLGQIFNYIFTIMLVGIISSLWISSLSLPRPAHRPRLHFVLLVFQWLLIPFVTLMYGAIPAIDAQTRLMFNKRLGFEVTEKIRKIQ